MVNLQQKGERTQSKIAITSERHLKCTLLICVLLVSGAYFMQYNIQYAI